MRLENRESLSAFLSPAGIPEPTTPAVDFNSEANDESWRSAFMAIADGCVEFQTPPEIKVWRGRSGDELICRLDDAECLLMPIRQYGRATWITMRVPPAMWEAYRANRAQLRELGVTAKKDAGQWQLVWREVTPASG